jgi:hypothetical protein
MLFQHLSLKPHAKDKHGGQQGLVLQEKIMEACEAKDHGHDSKQKHEVEGLIMQAKEWMREYRWCNPVEHVITKSQSKDECAGRKPEPGGGGSHPGRSA